MRRLAGVEVEDSIDDCIEVLKAVVKRVIEREWERIKGRLTKDVSKKQFIRAVEKNFEKYGKLLKIEKVVRTKNKEFIKVEQGIAKLTYVIASVAKETEIETVVRALQEIVDVTNREPLPLACLKGLKLHSSKIHRTPLSKERIKIVYRAESVPAFKTVIIKREGLKMKVWKGMSLKTNGGYVELNKLQYAKLTEGREVVHKVEEEVHLPHWRFALDVPVDPAMGGIKERATDPHEYNWVVTEVDEDGRVFISSPTLVRFDLEFEAS